MKDAPGSGDRRGRSVVWLVVVAALAANLCVFVWLWDRDQRREAAIVAAAEAETENRREQARAAVDRLAAEGERLKVEAADAGRRQAEDERSLREATEALDRSVAYPYDYPDVVASAKAGPDGSWVFLSSLHPTIQSGREKTPLYAFLVRPGRKPEQRPKEYYYWVTLEPEAFMEYLGSDYFEGAACRVESFRVTGEGEGNAIVVTRLDGKRWGFAVKDYQIRGGIHLLQ